VKDSANTQERKPNGSRAEEVARLAAFLRQHGYPRLHFIAILALSGGAGVLFSFLLLRQGMTSMQARYPVSVVVAYLVFLFLLNLWMRRQISRQGLIRLIEETPPPPLPTAIEPSERLAKKQKRWLRWYDWIDLPFYADSLFLSFMLMILVAMVALVGYVIAGSPDLLSEVLLDGLIVTGLWRRFHNHPGDLGTIGAAVRLTWVPALLTVAALWLLGMLLQAIDPSAVSLGRYFRK